MWPSLALLTLLLVQHRAALQCPGGCNCQLTWSDTRLDIDCRQRLRRDEVNDEELSQQLDRMLSADRFTERLTSLGIRNTPLTRVPAAICRLVNLTSLALDQNRLTALPDDCFTKLTKLAALSATSNAITALQDRLFDGLRSLATLDLKYNRISSIGRRVFTDSSDLTGLRYLDLAFNGLTSLEPWWYHRCTVGDVTSGATVVLRNNRISNFTNDLNFQFRCDMKRPYGHLDLSSNRISHIVDVFDGWNIGHGHGSLFTALICLLNLNGPSPRMKFNFKGNSYACDCKDFPLYSAVKTISRSGLLDGVSCSNPGFYSSIGQRVLVKTVPLTRFVCELPDRCPSTCRCVYRPANCTLHVYCSATNLSSLPLDLPPLPTRCARYKLDFSDNRLLRRLERRPYLVNTSVLDVSDSGLTEIGVDVLKQVSRIGSVNLRGNRLRSFPRHADTVNISASLRLGGNPWHCSCDDSWMIGWLKSLSPSDPGDVICTLPSRMYGKNILHSTEEDFCVDPVRRALTTTLSVVASVAAAVIIAGTLLYRLRIQFYSRWKFHPFDRDECVGEDMDYDAFLSCSSADDDPHGIRILGAMESNGYRVCYHERDFLPGQLITDNMVHGVERSKRTVCLISSNFLKR